MKKHDKIFKSVLLWLVGTWMSVTFWCFTLYNIKSNPLNTGEHHTRDGRTSHPRKQRWYPELQVAILQCWGHRVACVASRRAWLSWTLRHHPPGCPPCPPQKRSSVEVGPPGLRLFPLRRQRLHKSPLSWAPPGKGTEDAFKRKSSEHGHQRWPSQTLS